MKINLEISTILVLSAWSILIYSCATSPKRITKLDFQPESLRDVTGLPQGDDTYKLENGTLYLASRSKVTLVLESYCLSPGAAAPDRDEPYFFVRKTPPIPLYKEMILYFSKHPEVKQGLKQRLIWNLANEVKFEDLARDEQGLLLKIDPLAPLKVNSFLKEKAKKYFSKLIETYLPKEIQDALTIIKGKYYTYEDYERQIVSLRAQITETFPTDVVPQPVEGTNLYAIGRARGYSSMKIEVFNPSNPRSGSISFSDFFMQAKRRKFQIITPTDILAVRG